MLSLNFNYHLEPFNNTIQLYGDRAGGQGNYDFAGLAKLQTIKVVLLKGNPQSLKQPADWRRFQRLIHLAERLHKPVLLWNLPLKDNTFIENLTTVELGTAIRNTKIQLLRLPQPIISVFDESMEFDYDILGKEWVDASIVVQSDEKGVEEEKILKEYGLDVVGNKSDLPRKISELLDDYSSKSISELLATRIERVQETENN